MFWSSHFIQTPSIKSTFYNLSYSVLTRSSWLSLLSRIQLSINRVYEDHRENKCPLPLDGFNSHKLHKSLAGSCSPFAGGSKSSQYSSAAPSVKRKWRKGRRLAGVTNEDNKLQLQGVNVLINGCSEAAHIINLNRQHSLPTYCLQTQWFSHFLFPNKLFFICYWA